MSPRKHQTGTRMVSSLGGAILFILFVSWFNPVGFAAEGDDKKEKNGGGLLVTMFGGTVKRGLGLSAGDFAEFSLNRIRIVNAKLAAPPLHAEGETDTTYLQVDEILIEYSPFDLMNKHLLKKVVIDRPQLWISELTRKIEEDDNAKKPPNPTQASKPPQGGSVKLTIQRLELKNVEVYIDTLRKQGLNIPLRFAQNEPLVLEQLRLDELLNHPGSEKIVTVAADQVMVHSAYGPMAPLISVGKLEMSFTWKGLFNKELESLTLTDPALFIGEDWFMILKEFKTRTSTGDASPEEAQKKIQEENFMVKKFRIERLKISLSSFGVLTTELPFRFNYEAENVGLDQEGRFFLNSRLVINEPDFQMPDYNLSVQDLSGDMKFNWPPTAAAGDNIVPTLMADSLKFKNFLLTKPWASLTFVTDPNAAGGHPGQRPSPKAYLGFGAEFYGGYLNGHIQCDFLENWEAIVTGTNVGIDAINLVQGQPNLGVFQMSLRAHGNGADVEGTIDLVNDSGAPLQLNLKGDLNHFFANAAAIKAHLILGPDDKTRIGALIGKQREHSGEIQSLKNARLIGENKLGLLEARVAGIETKFPGADKLLAEENDERKQIYDFITRRDQRTLDQVELEYADLWQERSFPGEWIESPKRGWVAK